MDNPEVWLGYMGAKGYDVSSFGGVRTYRLSGRHGGRFGENPRLLRPIVHKRGYAYVCLVIGNGRRMTLVHRLVLETFVGPRPEGMECRHLDGNPTNNRLDNLAWGTREENLADSFRHGRLVRCSHKGMTSGASKLNDQQVLEMRRLREDGSSLAELALRFGVSGGTVCHICNHVTWRHLTAADSPIKRDIWRS
jgi:hypothetical protein